LKKNIYKILGELVAERRQNLGMTQQELADALKMSRPAIINMEAGRQRILVHRLMELETALSNYPLYKTLRKECK